MPIQPSVPGSVQIQQQNAQIFLGFGKAGRHLDGLAEDFFCLFMAVLFQVNRAQQSQHIHVPGVLLKGSPAQHNGTLDLTAVDEFNDFLKNSAASGNR